MSLGESRLPPDDFEGHPFSSRLKTGERLLWVGRPDKGMLMQQEWRQFRTGIVFGCFLAATALVGAFYSASPFEKSFSVFLLASLPVVLSLGLRSVHAAYRYAPWYALTDRHLFAATPDDDSFVVHETELKNIRDVSVQKTTPEVGTIRCLCHEVVFTLLSRNFNLEGVHRPDAVRELILESKHRASEMPF